MRILYLAEQLWPYIGGVEIFSTQLINALQKRGHEFFVITSRGSQNLPEQEIHNGMHMYRFLFEGALQRRNLGEIRTIQHRLARLKNDIQPDLVHLNGWAGSLYFYERTASVAVAPVLFSIHSPFRFTSDKNTLLGRLLLSSDWVNAVSNAILLDARSMVPEIASRSSVIYNSLELPNLEPSPLPTDKPKILCLARLVPEKGADVAIEAFALLVKRFPNARLVIAGDGRERSALEQQAARLGLTESIDFLGWVKPECVPELINSVSMLVVPSRYNEPFGLVALQAAQMARPVVATRCGGLPEIVTDQQTGLLVEKDDVLALADAIVFLLEHPTTAIRFGNAARQRVNEIFAWELFVDAYDGLYWKLGQKRNA